MLITNICASNYKDWLYREVSPNLAALPYWSQPSRPAYSLTSKFNGRRWVHEFKFACKSTWRDFLFGTTLDLLSCWHDTKHIVGSNNNLVTWQTPPITSKWVMTCLQYLTTSLVNILTTTTTTMNSLVVMHFRVESCQPFSGVCSVVIEFVSSKVKVCGVFCLKWRDLNIC